MALINTNQISIKGTDGEATLDSSFIRALAFNGVDNRENEINFVVKFAFYANKDKWIENSQKNEIKVEGIDVDRLQISYSRTRDGIDILAHIYTKIVEHLISKFPEWDPELIVPELQEPIDPSIGDPSIGDPSIGE